MAKGYVLKRIGKDKYINLSDPLKRFVSREVWGPIIRSYQIYGSIGAGISRGLLNIEKGSHTIAQRYGLRRDVAERAYRRFLFDKMRAEEEDREVPKSSDYFSAYSEETE